MLVDSWEEDPERDLVRILVTILVERESQRAIVIGRGGSLIKAISTEARHDLEEMLGRQVFLRANVRCEPRWRESRGILDLLDREAVAADFAVAGEPPRAGDEPPRVDAEPAEDHDQGDEDPSAEPAPDEARKRPPGSPAAGSST